MGKLKEKMLNNMTEQEMEDNYGISAFEYVELMSKYKESVEEEYIPTDEELQKLDAMLEEYYNSKEFRDYVENYQAGESLQQLEDDFFGKWTNEDIDAAIAQHNAHEEGFDLEDDWTDINNSMILKYTDDDVIQAVQKWKNEEWFITQIKRELNNTWNRKNGLN